MLDDVIDVVSCFHLIVYAVDCSIFDMSFYDDDVSSHDDRCDCGMINPQAKRHLRIEAERDGRKGLEDRRFTPKHRRPFALTPHKMESWNKQSSFSPAVKRAPISVEFGCHFVC